jgi:manganese/iron transport system substrate-binding protein
MLKSLPKPSRQTWLLSLFALTAGLVSDSALKPTNFIAQAQSKPIVVATNSVLCDLTKQIAQDTVDLKCLIEAGADPHEYQPQPSDRRSLETAKLVLYNGYEFEEGLIKLIESTSGTAPKIAVAEVAVPKPLLVEHEHEGAEKPGKPEMEPDPHVFHSAAHGAAMAKVVGQNLSKLNPAQASRYTTNTNKVAAELTQIDRWIKAQIATVPTSQRKLVTTHDAFNYYSAAYAIPVVGALQGVSTEEKPTAQRIAALVKEIKATRVPTIFAEATVNPKLIEAVAREAKVKVAGQRLFADGLGEPKSAADTYQKMLIANTQTIVEGLGGRYTAFRPTPSIGTGVPVR